MTEKRIIAGAAESAEASKEFSSILPEIPRRRHWGYRMEGRTYHIGTHGATEPPKSDLALEALGG